MYVENRTKIANFPTPMYLTPPMKGFPVEFGIGVRGPKCLNDGPTRWSKKFSDGFSRFDTIPAVTDTQPPSQPPSHAAVAITLNAKASSLINHAPLPRPPDVANLLSTPSRCTGNSPISYGTLRTHGTHRVDTMTSALQNMSNFRHFPLL